MAAQALRRHTHGPLQENGIVRSTVFPNAVRDVRVSKGFETLRAFGPKVSDITYTRLAKIERGEIVPSAEEMRRISLALRVNVDSLLIDPHAPGFDREAWARDHIEAKLANRGGGIEAMKLGAAVRVKRLEMGRSTTDMKDFGIPAATASRIENADRPIERWDAGIQKGVAMILGVRGAARIGAKVDAMFDAGELDDMLRELFSPEAIEERANRRVKALLSELSSHPTAARMLEDIRFAEASVPVMTGRVRADGAIAIAPGERRAILPEGSSADAMAIEIVDPVLGPGLPAGSVIAVDPAAAVGDGDVAVILSASSSRARVLSVSIEGGTMTGVSMTSDDHVDLNALPKGATLARMTAVLD